MLKALDQVFGSDSSKLDRRPSFDFISSWPTFDKALVAQYQIYNETCFFHFIVVVCFMLLFFPEEPGWSVWRDLARQHRSGTGLLHAHVALIVSVGLSQGHQGYRQKQSVWGGLRYCGNSFDLLFGFFCFSSMQKLSGYPRSQCEDALLKAIQQSEQLSRHHIVWWWNSHACC